MTASGVGYERVQEWVKAMLGCTHTTVVRTTAWAVRCVLVAQRVTPAALARALPAEQAGSGRARLTRVRRWWAGPPLDQAVVSPRLIQATLVLRPSSQSVVVALDPTRLGHWAVWLAGLVVAGRTLPQGGAVLPYPWPTGRFRATTLTLIQRLQAAFLVGVRWTLVAARAYTYLPSPVSYWPEGGTLWRMRVTASFQQVVKYRLCGGVAQLIPAGRAG